MTREAIIEKTINVLNKLPQEKINEVSDFADFIIKKYEEQLLTENIQQIISESNSFSFLNNEEELYTTADLKEAYNA